MSSSWIKLAGHFLHMLQKESRQPLRSIPALHGLAWQPLPNPAKARPLNGIHSVLWSVAIYIMSQAAEKYLVDEIDIEEQNMASCGYIFEKEHLMVILMAATLQDDIYD